MEARLSRFRANSELSRLNRSAGSWLLVSDILFDILAEAEAFRLRTEGLFNVNVLEALRASGYDQSFEKAALFSPSMLSASAALPLQPFMEMDAGMKAVKLRSGAQVDLGGIAKSWSVRKLSDWLRRKRGIKTGLINAGGDAAVWDERTDAAPSRAAYSKSMGCLQQRCDNNVFVMAALRHPARLGEAGKHRAAFIIILLIRAG